MVVLGFIALCALYGCCATLQNGFYNDLESPPEALASPADSSSDDPDEAGYIELEMQNRANGSPDEEAKDPETSLLRTLRN